MTFTLSTSPEVIAVLYGLVMFHVEPTQLVFIASQPSPDERGAEVDGYFEDLERQQTEDSDV